MHHCCLIHTERKIHVNHLSYDHRDIIAVEQSVILSKKINTMIWIHLARDFKQRLLWSRKVKTTSQFIYFSDLTLIVTRSAASVTLKAIQQFDQLTKHISTLWERTTAWVNSSCWQFIDEIEDRDLYILESKILIKICDTWSIIDLQKLMNVIVFMRLSLITISEILNLELLLNNKLHKQHHFAFQTLDNDVRILLKQSSSNLNSFTLARCHVSLSIRHVCIKIMSL